MMQNVHLERDGNTLIVKIDLTKTHGPSSSGKTMIVASTRGNEKVPDTEGTMISLNCYRYVEQSKGAKKRKAREGGKK